MRYTFVTEMIMANPLFVDGDMLWANLPYYASESKTEKVEYETSLPPIRELNNKNIINSVVQFNLKLITDRRCPPAFRNTLIAERIWPILLSSHMHRVYRKTHYKEVKEHLVEGSGLSHLSRSNINWNNYLSCS
ncbi:hypothetical protein EB796_024205 [Bugula neritina]|uniref:Uncharacterized protein n=1 Tax=Bugula neritina TaxID=10212 RepID=A0A7J7IU88_BUGNE|nr:hypothetical protein EB796_024205 [Bugula neritina]